MIGFWLTAAAMVSIALAFVVTPLLRSRATATAPRGMLTIAVHDDRLRELGLDLAEGRIDQSLYQTAKQELERELLHDLDERAPKTPGCDRQPRWSGVVAVALVVPLLATLGYWRLGEYGLIDEARAAQRLALPTPEEMVRQLSQRLDQQPDDVRAWQLLAQGYLAMGRYPEAVDAYERALAVAGDTAELLAGYGEALSMIDGEAISGRSLDFIERALALDPQQPKALWLSGIGAYQRGELARAVGAWERLIGLLPPDSANAETVNKAIVETRRELGESSQPTPVVSEAGK
ncbi:c-type cytochrome biogenesis protein CcmI [Sedimenticola hydrogenitrophicus]|uniref:c-type cytochrome biogenesis protein CcmI n=1 Tax=Sedimenticola hydrogenitrophicus TaxID=2967975 RepID=UPI0021A71DB0|nr:c-type cytochrome biogenesis protein CcmI [Sedimenticola hydrogenitrophicus]